VVESCFKGRPLYLCTYSMSTCKSAVDVLLRCLTRLTANHMASSLDVQPKRTLSNYLDLCSDRDGSSNSRIMSSFVMPMERGVNGGDNEEEDFPARKLRWSTIGLLTELNVGSELVMLD